MAYLRERRGGKRGETLAHVYCHKGGGATPTSASEKAFARGIAQRAAELGFGLDRFELAAGQLTVRKLARIFEARGIRGAVISGARQLEEPLDPLLARGACCLGGTAHPEYPVHRARAMPYHNGHLAVRELSALGYRRIGLYLDRGTDENQFHA